MQVKLKVHIKNVNRRFDVKPVKKTNNYYRTQDLDDFRFFYSIFSVGVFSFFQSKYLY